MFRYFNKGKMTEANFRTEELDRENCKMLLLISNPSGWYGKNDDSSSK